MPTMLEVPDNCLAILVGPTILETNLFVEGVRVPYIQELRLHAEAARPSPKLDVVFLKLPAGCSLAPQIAESRGRVEEALRRVRAIVPEPRPLTIWERLREIGGAG